MKEEEQGLELAKEGVKQLLEPVTAIMKSLLGPSAAEIGLAWGDSFRVWRVKRSVRLLQDAQQFASEAGLQLKAVAPRLLFPILESASLEDDEDLHSRWVALLANEATTKNSVHPSFIEILKQLTSEDARLLDRLSDSCQGKRSRVVSPWADSISHSERERRIAAGDNSESSFETLVRLGLIEAEYDLDGGKLKIRFLDVTDAKIDGELDGYYVLTESADAFVKACRAPKKS